MAPSWIFYNILVVTSCNALPVDISGGSVKLPSRSLVILVVVATLLAILSFTAVISYWNAALFAVCRARPIDATSAGSAGAAPRSVDANRSRGGPWPSGNRKVSAATASRSSMGRLATSTRSAQPAPVRAALPIPRQALKTKLAAPVVGSR